MEDNDSNPQKSSFEPDAQRANPCPSCGHPIAAVTTTGPTTHVAQSCGCEIPHQPMTVNFHEDLTAFQRDVLEAIARIDRRNDTPYGLGICEELERDYEDVLHPRLYSSLDGLEELGLVERSAVDRRTNRYDLTDRGRRLLRDHAASLAAAIGCEITSDAVADGGSA